MDGSRLMKKEMADRHKLMRGEWIDSVNLAQNDATKIHLSKKSTCRCRARHEKAIDSTRPELTAKSAWLQRRKGGF